MRNKKVLAGAMLGVMLASTTMTTVAYAGGLQKYDEKTVYNEEVSDKNGNLKEGYIKCDESKPGAVLYKTYTYKTINANGFKEVDEDTFDDCEDEKLKKSEKVGFTDYREVDINSDDLKNAKMKGTDYWKKETSRVDNDSQIDKANNLPVFDANGVVYNYIASGDVTLCNHTRGNVLAGGTVTNKGTVDGTIDVLDTKDFEKKWSEIGETFGYKVTQKHLDKLAYNYANEWMRKLTDDGSDQKVRFGDCPIYYYAGTGTINFTGIWGTLIAPNATVKVASCNWCGTIVAKEIVSCGEAHLWSWNDKKTDEEHYFVREDNIKYYVTTYDNHVEKEFCVLTKGTTPETGDDICLFLVGTAAAIAASVLGALGFKKKKNK